MKPSEIQEGKTYCNKGRGLTARKVLKIGRDIPCTWLGFGDPPDEPVVKYQGVNLFGRPTGPERTMFLGSFTKWAGREIKSPGA